MAACFSLPPLFIGVGYFTALSVPRLYDRVMMNWKGFRRKRSWLSGCSAPAFTRGDKGNPQKTSVRTAGVLVEIRTHHFLSTVSSSSATLSCSVYLMLKWPTQWARIFFEKPAVFQLMKNLSPCVEPKSSNSPNTCSELAESNLHPDSPFL
jgi:hypothetical protein